MTTYFAKVKIDHTPKHCRNVVMCIKTFGNGAEEAKQNVTNMILHNWTDILSVEVLKISNSPILIEKFIVCGVLKLNSGKTKEVKISVRAEDETEAESIFKQIIGNWRGLVSSQITEIILA